MRIICNRSKFATPQAQAQHQRECSQGTTTVKAITKTRSELQAQSRLWCISPFSILCEFGCNFYLHTSKEPIELFRIVILTFENEARSEELWRFMCDDTNVGFNGYNCNCKKFRTNTRDETKILLAQLKELKECFLLCIWSELQLIHPKKIFAILSILSWCCYGTIMVLSTHTFVPVITFDYEWLRRSFSYVIGAKLKRALIDVIKNRHRHSAIRDMWHQRRNDVFDGITQNRLWACSR